MRPSSTALDGHARARLGIHTVAAGESLTSIAGRYQVPEAFIDRMNTGAHVDLKTGDELWVPAGDVSQLRAGPRLGHGAAHAPRQGTANRCWSISRRYGMSVPQLARMNHVSTGTVLQPGQRLQVAGSGGSAILPRHGLDQAGSPPRAAKVNYKVRRGDTLSDIARRFEVTVRDLQAWNNMGRSTALRAGQFLTIRVAGDKSFGS